MKRIRNDLWDLDELDVMLLRELEQDARVSYVALASKLGTSHSTVGRRVKRLIDQGIVTIAAIPSYEALGYGTILTLAVKAPPGMVNALAERFASASSINYLWVTAGHYDILAVALYRSPKEYMKLFPEEIGDIPENTRIETMLSFNLDKNSSSLLTDDTIVDSRLQFIPTKLDFSVISGLEISPLASLSELAGNIGASVSSVFSSIRKLTSQGIIRVRGIPNPEAFGHTIRAVILIHVQPSRLKSLTAILRVYPSITHVNLIFGSFNCIIWATFQNSDEMCTFMDQDLGNMPGVVHSESLVILRIQKKPFGLISGDGSHVNDT